MIGLELGGITIPLDSVIGGLHQTYQQAQPRTLKRKVNGDALLLDGAASNKLRTRISGRGWVIAGLDGLDYTQVMTLKCIKPRGINSASNVISIPAARRSDTEFLPLGFACLSDGQRIPTTIDIVSDTATLGVVSGAVIYQVEYYPQLQVNIVQPPDESFDRSDVNFTWSIVAEEI